MNPISVILILSLICAVISAVIIGNFWLILVLFVGFALAFSILFWLILAVFSAVIPRGKVYSEPSDVYIWLLNTAYAFVCAGAGVKVKAKGLEKLPERPFLLVSNHRSQLDNMVQCLAIRPRKIAYIAKAELFKIPIVRGLITRCCYISLGRKSSRNDKSAIETAEDYINRGVMSIGVYPEGHRGKDGQMLKFHAGSFKTAIGTGCPVVVSAITGTEKVHKRFPFRRTEVNFDIIEVVNPKGRKSIELSEDIQKIIKKHIEECGI